ncbi:MAG: F0F1 ATP synthase subunit gamma, partial [Mycoplasmoidaceae bacterium]|nr:F0F1 ATP synthase subunit gamma [Mycoplasmoidaceae bacterium]
MQSLENIKKRIKSVKTTSKITGAMKLIAIANIRKQSKEFEKISSFCKDFYYVIKPLITVASEHPEVHKDNGKTLYILICSALGLCGGFNINICKHLIERLKPEDRIIVIGKKGYSYLKSKGYSKQIIESIDVSNKNINYLEIVPISELAIDLY